MTPQNFSHSSNSKRSNDSHSKLSELINTLSSLYGHYLPSEIKVSKRSLEQHMVQKNKLMIQFIKHPCLVNEAKRKCMFCLHYVWLIMFAPHHSMPIASSQQLKTRKKKAEATSPSLLTNSWISVTDDSQLFHPH